MELELDVCEVLQDGFVVVLNHLSEQINILENR